MSGTVGPSLEMPGATEGMLTGAAITASVCRATLTKLMHSKHGTCLEGPLLALVYLDIDSIVKDLP